MAYFTWKSHRLTTDPLKIFDALSQRRNCFFLDSSLNSDYFLGRYSFLGCDPFLILKTEAQAPFKKLRENLNRYRLSVSESEIPFLGGAVGYLAYDLGLALEKKVKKITKGKPDIPDSLFGFYNTIIIIDHLKQLIHILSTGFPEKSHRLARLLCAQNLKKFYKLLSRAESVKGPSEINKCPQPAKLNSDFTEEGYLTAIKKAKEYIRRGDIYQVNLSQRFQADVDSPAREIYKRLRRISPSYFSAYFDAGDFQILSSSPERFLSLRGDIVTTRPMKGTRPRAKDRLKDKRFKKDLLESAKDKAELIMIVDLERNDLGRVCSYDSIKVSVLRQLEEYNTVFQTTANILGRLHKDKDRIDLLRACFPGGSVTGCPKIRAMEIIEELEPTRRSIYTGSLGYLSFSGNMDFNILIRTILKKCDTIYFGSGGGIVADSKPGEEYLETLVKAKAMIEAISRPG